MSSGANKVGRTWAVNPERPPPRTETPAVVEEAVASAFAAPEGFEELERRAYDDTEFVVLRAA